MNVKEKLEIFTKITIKEAEAKREILLEEIEKKFENACEEYRIHAQKKADSLINEETYKTQQVINKDVIKATAEAKHSVIDIRNSLTEKLFADVLSMVMNYTKTAEYEETLVSDIKNCVLEYSNITVWISKNDMRLADRIKSITGVVLNEETENMLGGFKAQVTGRNIFIDNSYSQRLSDARNNFSGFASN